MESTPTLISKCVVTHGLLIRASLLAFLIIPKWRKMNWEGHSKFNPSHLFEFLFYFFPLFFWWLWSVGVWPIWWIVPSILKAKPFKMIAPTEGLFDFVLTKREVLLAENLSHCRLPPTSSTGYKHYKLMLLLIALSVWMLLFATLYDLTQDGGKVWCTWDQGTQSIPLVI